MPRIHINMKGEPGVCRAARSCPFGGEDDHYSSPEEARAAYEAKMNEPVAPSLSRSDRTSGTDILQAQRDHVRANENLGLTAETRQGILPDSDDDEAELRRKQEFARKLVQSGDARGAIEAMDAALRLEQEIGRLKAGPVAQPLPRAATSKETSILRYGRSTLRPSSPPPGLPGWTAA